MSIAVDLADLLRGAGQGRFVDDDAPLDVATIRRIACDANIHRVVRQGRSAILDFGTTTKVISAPLFAALAERDGGCRFPGCDRPVDWTHAHHIRHWSDGGPTTPHNLCLLCARHHHLIPQRGWNIALHPDATIEITTPTGQLRTSRPPLRRSACIPLRC